MKTLLLTALLAAPAAAFAQMQPTLPTNAELIAAGKEMPAPFKGATTILLHTPDSTAAVALRKFARALLSQGIEPDRIDPEVGYLSTKGKAVGQMTPAVFQYRVLSAAEPGGTLLTITGDFTVRTGFANSMTVPMAWTKSNLLQAKLCFSTIESAALAYAGARIGYVAGSLARPVMH